MRADVSDILAARAPDDRGLSRLVGWSVGAHLVGLAIALFLPSGWLGAQPDRVEVMVISLGGSVGERSTGTTPIAGKQIDQAVERPRPEPPKPPAATRPDEMPPPRTTPVTAKPTPPPPKTTAPPAATTKPPVTGAQVQAGSAAADTGAKGRADGLTFGGGAGGGDAVDLNAFDPEWVAKFKSAITRVWDRLQPDAGYVVIRFGIRRDGSLSATVPVTVIESSRHFLLEQTSRRTLLNARLPPLPASYEGTELVVRLRFDYEKR